MTKAKTKEVVSNDEAFERAVEDAHAADDGRNDGSLENAIEDAQVAHDQKAIEEAGDTEPPGPDVEAPVAVGPDDADGSLHEEASDGQKSGAHVDAPSEAPASDLAGDASV